MESSSPRCAEVGQKCRDRLVRLGGEARVIGRDVLMAVPAPLVLHAAGIDLHAAHAALDHAAGNQALLREVSALGVVQTIQRLRRRTFLLHIERLGAAICMR